jgi:hypothetical protein
MSADPTAILFYGFPLPRLVVDYHDLNEQWVGGRRPKQPDDRSDYKSPEWEDWRTRLREWEATVENAKISWSGSEQCEQFFVHCAGLKKSVEWNELLAVSADDLSHPTGAKEMLHAFCDKFNLPKGEPQWYLAARYF